MPPYHSGQSPHAHTHMNTHTHNHTHATVITHPPNPLVRESPAPNSSPRREPLPPRPLRPLVSQHEPRHAACISTPDRSALSHVERASHATSSRRALAGPRRSTPTPRQLGAPYSPLLHTTPYNPRLLGPVLTPPEGAQLSDARMSRNLGPRGSHLAWTHRVWMLHSCLPHGSRRLLSRARRCLRMVLRG